MDSLCCVILFKMQTKRYQPVRRQKGYTGSYSGVVAMLTRKIKSAPANENMQFLIFLLAKSCIICSRFIGIK